MARMNQELKIGELAEHAGVSRDTVRFYEREGLLPPAQTRCPRGWTGRRSSSFDRIGRRMPFAQRAAFANLWLARGLVTHSLEGSPTTNAMVRTTTAVTMLQAGTKDNGLPSHARAVVNLRILPGDSVATVVEHVRRAVDDERVEVRIAGRFTAEPSAVSSTDSEAFRRLERTIRSATPGAVVAPYLVLVATDARYFTSLSRTVFRFLPLRLTSRDMERMHGIDERIGISEYEAAIRTYRQLVVEAAGS